MKILPSSKFPLALHSPPNPSSWPWSIFLSFLYCGLFQHFGITFHICSFYLAASLSGFCVPLLHGNTTPSFTWPSNNVPLYRWTALCLPIPILKDVLLAYNWGKCEWSCYKLQWTFKNTIKIVCFSWAASAFVRLLLWLIDSECPWMFPRDIRHHKSSFPIDACKLSR